MCEFKFEGFFVLHDTATTLLYTYCHTRSLHDALPMSASRSCVHDDSPVQIPVEVSSALTSQMRWEPTLTSRPLIWPRRSHPSTVWRCATTRSAYSWRVNSPSCRRGTFPDQIGSVVPRPPRCMRRRLSGELKHSFSGGPP